MKQIKIKEFLIVGGFCLLALQGCIPKDATPNDPAYAPPVPQTQIPPQNDTGGIYQSGYESRLFEDRRAIRVGDMITIRLVEKTSSSKDASTKTKKESKTDMSNPTTLGMTPRTNQINLSETENSKRNFDGQASSSQNNQLSGTITVSIYEVLPNGYLKVRGEKWLNINRGDEYVRLTGIVRPDDLDDTNSVNSDRVGDVRISYSGTGEVAQSNATGWLGKFFSSVFWPF